MADWKAKATELSYSILTGVQKMLQFLKENNFTQLNETSNRTVGHATDLIDIIKVHFGDPQKDVEKKVLDCMQELKTSILDTLQATKSVVAKPKSSESQDHLKHACRTVAERIKKLNLSIVGLGEIKDSPDKDKSSGVSVDGVDPEVSESVDVAIASLKAILVAALKTKDQKELVENAKVLSVQCQKLIGLAKSAGREEWMKEPKDFTFEAISAARSVFKTELVTPEIEESLTKSINKTISSMKSVVTNFGTIKKPDTNVSKNNNVNDLKRQSTWLQNEFSTRDPENVFKILQPLGEGASGVVYKAMHKETKRLLAIKKLKVGVNNLKRTIDEIKIMKGLKSKYTLKYYGCYKKDDHIWIIMEYCDAGSVQDLVDAREESKDNICLTEDQIAAIISQVLKGLDHLHYLKKIHRDIKAGNILLTTKGVAKLADFGISAQLEGDEPRFTTIGSSYWMAPEILSCSGYDSRADIWSLGITLLEMAEGIPPRIEEMPNRAVHRILNEPPPTLRDPSLWSDVFKDFLNRCLQKNPEKRWTAVQLLDHPFIKNARTDAIQEIVSKKKSKKTKYATEKGKVLRVYFQANMKAIMVPIHATTEDVCRICSEMFQITKPPAEYKLYLVEEGANGTEHNTRVLGTYDYPHIEYEKAKKKNKKAKNSTSDPFSKDAVKFIYQ